MIPFETLSMTVDSHVACLALNRPKSANSINEPMWQELRQAFEQLDQMSDVRVVILTGAGRHFSTGIDLTYLASLLGELNRQPEGFRQEKLFRLISDLQGAVNTVEKCRKPVLAAIQGYCLGAGLDLATACDMRYATAATRFSVKEVDLAIVADLGVLQRLPGIVGEGVARELAFTGRTFKGEEAQSYGLVNRLFENTETLQSGVMALAQDLAGKSSLTLRGVKETLNYSRDHSVADGLQFVALRNAAMLLSKDLAEAAAAVTEKRLPRFS